MKRTHFIGLDTHCEFCELVAITDSGIVSQRERCATAIPTLVEAIDKVPRPRHLVIEEGPIADWLYRNLVRHVDEMLVCDPRRNHLIAKDSDKDDPIDALKLVQLYRGGYVKAVHHPESFDRAVLKQHVALYHDRVRQRVREANRVMSQLRRHGVFVCEGAFLARSQRDELLGRLPSNVVLRSNVELLWKSYDLACEQVNEMRQRLIRLGRQEDQVRRFTDVPGIAWIRAATLFAYVDTPRNLAAQRTPQCGSKPGPGAPGWGMWKAGGVYRPEWVGVATASALEGSSR